MTVVRQSGRSESSLKCGVFVRVAVTVLILAYLGFKVHWAELGKQFLRSDPLWLLIACFIFGAAFLLGSLRWWLLLKVQEIYLPFRVVTALTFVGQFFNSFLLGATGGDVVRTFYTLKYNPQQKTHATLSVIVDRVMGVVTLLFCALIGLAWQLGRVMQRDDIRVIGLALLVVFGVIVAGMTSLALMPFRRLPAVFHRLWHTIPRRHNLELLIGGLRQHGKSAHLTIKALLCSFAIHVLVFTAGFCIAQAIHLDATYGEIIVVLAVVICVVSLPISIGGHGVREGAFVLMFAAFGIISIDRYTGMGQEPAILFSLLFFALLSVWSFIGGLIYLTFDHAYHNAGSSAPR